MTHRTPPTHQRAACCVQLYGHPAVRALLADSFHPGGLDLTTELGHRLRISSGDRVLDVGAGMGASALHLAATLGCRVTGLTLEDGLAAEGRRIADERGMADRVDLRVGDISETVIPDEAFEAAIAECVLSTMPSPEMVIHRVAKSLKPGGRFGITDVVVQGELSDELKHPFAQAACLGSGLTLDRVTEWLRAEGLVMVERESLPKVAERFVAKLHTRLLAAEIAAKLGKLAIPVDTVMTAKRMVRAAHDSVNEGVLGYALWVAEKP